MSQHNSTDQQIEPNHHLENILITFDIDGTLLIGLNKGMVHHNSYKGAVYDIFGVQEDLPKYRPGTDLGISKQIIEYTLKMLNSTQKNNEDNQKNTYNNSINDEIIQKFIKRTEDHYIELFDGKLTVMPGITETLNYLSNIPNVKIALCTGNFRRIALLKLEKANLTKYFSPYVIGGFGNNCESRTDILIESHRNAEKVYGIKFDRFIHIGDSPADIEAANNIGTTSILVKTTPYDFQPSEYHNPKFIFSNLKNNFEDLVSIIKTGKATDAYYKENQNSN